ncbi:MAG: NHLP leader peptide family RiPP precursor [Gemmatimonadaceae bacterium]|nr:NHLP leader peptide family RiPP precursor [Gemmatimonadaceae bacterium]
MGQTNSHESPERSRALQAVLARASTDRDFRQRLLVDPKSAIHDALGIVIPPTFRVRFIERDPSVDSLVVLPDYTSPDGELCDADLETIAGGTDGGWDGGGNPPPPSGTW